MIRDGTGAQGATHFGELKALQAPQNTPPAQLEFADGVSELLEISEKSSKREKTGRTEGQILIPIFKTGWILNMNHQLQDWSLNKWVSSWKRACNH